MIGRDVVLGGNVLGGNGSAFNPALPVVTGPFVELKRASVYVYTAWDPSDNAGTVTNAPNSSQATSSAASYITVSNTTGTTTWTAVTAGLYRFSIQLQNENLTASTRIFNPVALGGTATILLGTPTLISPVYTETAMTGQTQLTGHATFYANMTAGQTVTILPKVALSSVSAVTSFTQQCTVAAEYCGQTAN